MENNRVTLSGNLLTWFKDIPKWFQEDIGVDFNSITAEAQSLHLALIGLNYGTKLQKKWDGEWFGKGKERSGTSQRPSWQDKRPV